MCIQLCCLQPRGREVCRLKAISQGISSFVVPTSAKGIGFCRILAVHTGGGDIIRPGGGGGQLRQALLAENSPGDRFQRGTLICMTYLCGLSHSFVFPRKRT